MSPIDPPKATDDFVPLGERIRAATRRDAAKDQALPQIERLKTYTRDVEAA